MSDRRAVSAGHLAASSVAANEPWRVAVGGNRVQNMTVEQIAQAFAAGQLSVRTPLWPPGTSGWQALGNFEQFQSGAYAQPAPYAQPGSYGQLSQFEEADDDPTRMWTGSSDLSELPGMDMAPVPPVPSAPPSPQRPSARTGPRQVSSPAPRSVPAPAPVARTVSMAAAPMAQPPLRPRRSSGLWLVAGLVGLVGLGSAVLAARGNWSIAAPAEATVAAAKPAPEPLRPPPSTLAEPVAQLQVPVPAPAAPSAEPAAPGAAVTPVTPPSEVNQAQLAKYEESRASAFVAEAQAATPATAKKRASEKRLTERKTATARKEDSRKEEPKSTPAVEAKQEDAAKESAKVSSTTAKRATAAVAAKPKSEPKAETKPEATPVSSAVNDAAAEALGNAANLAASCRPRGGPSGPGRVRVIYSNDGSVKTVEILTAKFRDTVTGSCVSMMFRRAKIPAFKGEPPTFMKSFTIPEE